MKRIVRLTENDLTRIVRKVIKEQTGLSKIKDEVLGELDYEYFEDFEDSEDIADALIKALGLRGSNASWIDVAASFVIPIVLAFGDTDSKPGSVPYRNQTSELESEMSKSDDKIEQLLRDDEEEIAEALFIAIAKNLSLIHI
jgi:hypothetical protein